MVSDSVNEVGESSRSNRLPHSTRSKRRVSGRCHEAVQSSAKRFSRRLDRLISSVTDGALGPDNYSYLDNGDCDCVCEFCGALFWFDERQLRAPRSQRPRYTMCCREGAVFSPPPLHPPYVIRELFADPQFMDNIRAYNSMFSMASFGAEIDDSVNCGRGPYVFKVSGQVSHWLGSLCPAPNEKPCFLQMYIHDTENEISNRMRFFSSSNQTSQRSISPEVVSVISQTLQNCNEYVRLFQSAFDVCSSGNVPEFCVRLYNGRHERTYEPPAPGTLGAILRDNDPNATSYDIIVRSKDGIPQRVSKLHPSYMPLQYPLLFPFAEQGWSPQLRLQPHAKSKDRHLTMNMYYSYQIHDRQGVFSLVLKAGRLFQQYLVDAYICIEQSRLDFISHNQDDLRSEFMSGVHVAILRGDTEGRDIGNRIFLPSSFTGGPRYMYKHYQDALAICGVHGNPQYFITFTCNVKWPEITRFLNKSGYKHAEDPPDIIARLFQIKVDEFIKFLKTEKPFGDVVAELYTIEFQKRGLPHCHTLLWVAPAFKIKDASEIDQYISAEIADPTLEPCLQEIITQCMMHGPCGVLKSTAPCMRDNECKKSFPKPFETETHFDKDGYVHYKRRSQGLHVLKDGIPLDNGYVVPYNRALCKRFNAHINVEYCGWSMMIKYLFKYITKGVERIMFSITRPDATPNDVQNEPNVPVNEIQNFVDGRYICPHVAAWRILNFPIHHRNPAVQVLAVHLEGMQNVTFKDDMYLRNVVRRPGFGKTTLTEWLRNNQLHPEGRDLCYTEYLSRYRWDVSSKIWVRRLTSRAPSIGRLIYIHPTCGELFYLRLLLCHQKGCRSFADIRTVSGVVCNTYRAACEKLGLIGDDQEWSSTFMEASNWVSSGELRLLFTHMLLFCDVANPLVLWEEHWKKMSDDMLLNLKNHSTQPHRCVNDDDLQQYVLLELEQLLNSGNPSRSLSNFGLPLPSTALLSSLRNRLIMEERCYDRQRLTEQHLQSRRLLNNDQTHVYNIVMNSHTNKSQTLLFVYGHGGTGKTFLWTTVIAALRSVGDIVLAVAGSGIASLLLPAGRTAHSRFKQPIDLSEQSMCFIKKTPNFQNSLKKHH